jgi:effector-binding domain-containing protein
MHTILKSNLAILKTTVFTGTVIIFCACNGGDKKSTETKTDTVKTTVTEKPVEKTTVVKPAIINILDTIAPKRIVVYMKDSAATIDRIGLKLGQIYGVKLADVLKKNGIKATGAPMAWYKGVKAPYFFEAGLPVNKKPAKLPKGVFVKEMASDSAVVAHFYGPYDLLSQGYDALKEWLKDAKKSGNGAPYEIYVGDPVDKNGKPLDPYKVRTDIVFPHK